MRKELLPRIDGYFRGAKNWLWRLWKRHGLADRFRVRGSVSSTLYYSQFHPKYKLSGMVYRHHDMGSNIVVVNGRNMFAGLIVGGAGGWGGYNELGGPELGYVVRGIGLGSDATPETDTDTALVSPHQNPALGPHYYHPVDDIIFAAPPSTSVTFCRTFSPTEPNPGGVITIREYGLYTASPGPGGPYPAEPAVTVPPGPAGGHFLVARKTYGPVTKDTNFTLIVRWTLEF